MWATACRDVKQTFVPYFRRALQALRTETSLNACRQVGSLIHFVEDTGAPPHAREQCPHHSELENWVRGDQVIIKGYRPQLLGKTDAEAEAGFLRRMAGLVTFSKARAERALPLVSQPKPDRVKVEPIILESALESARVTADVLYTLFTLGLGPQPQGASLVGTVTAATLPLRDNHGARIVLLGTDFATLATTADPRPSALQWGGTYELRNLPPGDYRVLAYRTGSQVRVSKPVHLESGKPTRLDIGVPRRRARGKCHRKSRRPAGIAAIRRSRPVDRCFGGAAAPMEQHRRLRGAARDLPLRGRAEGPGGEGPVCILGAAEPPEQASAGADLPAFGGQQAPRRVDDHAGRPAVERDGSGSHDPPLKRGN